MLRAEFVNTTISESNVDVLREQPTNVTTEESYKNACKRISISSDKYNLTNLIELEPKNALAIMYGKVRQELGENEGMVPRETNSILVSYASDLLHKFSYEESIGLDKLANTWNRLLKHNHTYSVTMLSSLKHLTNMVSLGNAEIHIANLEHFAVFCTYKGVSSLKLSMCTSAKTVMRDSESTAQKHKKALAAVMRQSDNPKQANKRYMPKTKANAQDNENQRLSANGVDAIETKQAHDEQNVVSAKRKRGRPPGSATKTDANRTDNVNAMVKDVSAIQYMLLNENAAMHMSKSKLTSVEKHISKALDLLKGKKRS